jgi:hypothetical protein
LSPNDGRRRNRRLFLKYNPLWKENTGLSGTDYIQISPYKSTHTFQNLESTGAGVINFSHDGALFVYTALGDPVLPGFPAERVQGTVLENCSFWEVRVEKQNDRGNR